MGRRFGAEVWRVTSRGRIALVVLIASVYAVCYIAIKAGLSSAPPVAYAGLRALIAGLALLAYAAARRKRLLPPRRLWRTVVAIAAAGTTIGFGAMFLSPGRTGAGIVRAREHRPAHDRRPCCGVSR